MKRMLITGLLALCVLFTGCTMYTQDADGNIVATTMVPVDDGYSPLVSDYVGVPFLGGWGSGYYNTGYYGANWNHANWSHSGYYNRTWNGYRGCYHRGAVAWREPNGGGAAWHGPRGGGAVVVRSGAGYRGGGGFRGRH